MADLILGSTTAMTESGGTVTLDSAVAGVGLSNFQQFRLTTGKNGITSLSFIDRLIFLIFLS